MNLSTLIDIDSNELTTILNILQKILPHHDVWAFGSRVTRSAKKFSDLDIVIMSENPLPFSTIAELQDAFSESNLSIKVDIVDWARLDDDFRQIILANHVSLKCKYSV